MNFILFDGASRENLLPFTYTRPVAEVRVGILTLKEKWELFLGNTTTYLTEDYLEEKYPMVEFEENVFIDASILPTYELVVQIKSLAPHQAIVHNGIVIAFYATDSAEEVDFDDYEQIYASDDILKIENLTDIFLHNFKAIALDFELITHNRESEPISKTNNVIGESNVFLEKGAVLEYATINAIDGPVYIGKDTLVMEGSLIRGPFALCEKSMVKMGAKIYGGTTIGPNSTIGGEIKNVVMFGNSNKGHDGYLGNSVVGEWCNIGADTNCSNMKNNHGNVKIWNYAERCFLDSEKQFCGVFLGDYSKLGINTMLNTGTVIGVVSNVFGSGFPDKFIPSFSWGAPNTASTYILDKALEDIKKMTVLKKKVFDKKDKAILAKVFEITGDFRE